MAETRHRNNDDSGDNDPAVTTGESSSASDLVQESSTMRWEGHRTQGANIALGLRYDDTVRALERRSDDREAKEVLLRLAKELKQLNDAMAGRLLRMSAVNRTVVEVLQKSEDGKAALMMRKAAELLVKGLANAEEEIHSLKATVAELEGQRDHYKAVLAKTNSELESSLAYAQVSKAIGEQAGVTAPAITAASSLSVGDDPVRRRPANRRGGGKGGGGGDGGKAKGKGKAPARSPQEQPERQSSALAPAISMSESAGDSNRGGSDNEASEVAEPPIIADAAAAFRAALMAAGIGGGDENEGGEGQDRAASPASPKAASRKRRRIDAGSSVVAGRGSDGAGGAKRSRDQAESFGLLGGGNDGYGGGEEGSQGRRGNGDEARNDQNHDDDGDVDGGESGSGAGEERRWRPREDDERKGKFSGGGSSGSGGRRGERTVQGAGGGTKQRGVEVTPVTTVNDGGTESLGSGGGSGGRDGGSGIGHGGADDGGDSGGAQGEDLRDAYDSDSAPSMFF